MILRTLSQPAVAGGRLATEAGLSAVMIRKPACNITTRSVASLTDTFALWLP